ncbi:hypothetical protein MMC26_000313 [Xylographa opegraphella]|nr:hypothetical protein [Xylographa opegraphella]
MAAPKSTPLPLPSRNPLPLSAGQEQQVRDLYYKRVRGYCADEIRDFAACALHRTISATWACRRQRLSMNRCMIAHATQQEQDAAREEWFASRDKRIEEREAKERRKVEQEKFHREWWGLPPVEGEGGKGEAGAEAREER